MHWHAIIIIGLIPLGLKPLVASTITPSTPVVVQGGDQINKVDAQGRKQGYWRILGPDSEKPGYAAGQLIEEGNYENNRRIGTWKRYWPNGGLKSEINYVMGRPRGRYTTYYPNGNVEENGSWDLDRNTGKFMRYHPNGKLAQQFAFNDYGQRDGMQRYYHENGQLAVEVNINEGREEGTLKRWYANGDLQQVAEFNGGVINAENSRYIKPVNRNPAPTPDPNAKAAPVPSAEESTNEAIRFRENGHNTLYDKELRISQVGEFRAGRLWNGRYYRYDGNGRLMRIEMYVEGRYAGLGVIDEDDKR